MFLLFFFLQYFMDIFFSSSLHHEIRIMNNQPIGIFDSGLGGLSVWREVIKLLPAENIIYLADSGNCPYGGKSDEQIKHLVFRCVRFLLSHRCKLIVVACNTATAAAIDDLRLTFKLPFVGMEPAVKPAALNSQTGHVGILATQGTFNGRLFKETSQKFATNIELHIQVGFGLVELVEKALTQSEEAHQLLEAYITPMLEKNIDHLVLGCTHYPFLINRIKEITGDNMVILDPSPAVARRTADLIESLKLDSKRSEKNVDYHFYTTGNIEVMKQFIKNQLNFDSIPEKADLSIF